MAIIFLNGRSHAKDMVGLWQTDIYQVSPGGGTNTIGAYETVELRSDGSATVMQVLKGKDGRDISIPQSGTYKIGDTNHLTLELAASSILPSHKTPHRFTYKLSGDELILSAIDPWNGREITKSYYRGNKK